MSHIIHAPNPIPGYGYKVFLAGSIEMGKAIDWQADLTRELEALDITILNPRRPDWDASWKQTKDDPQFRRQVEWELDALSAADLIVMYLAPGTMSPISLLELGLFTNRAAGCDKDMMVCCPEGFWRKGNVEIVAERYGVPLFDDWTTFVAAIKNHITSTL